MQNLERQAGDEPSVIERMKKVQVVLDLEKKFVQERDEYLETLPSHYRRLAALLDMTLVPTPPHPLKYRRVLFWGLWATPEEARDAVKKEADPFTGLPYDDVFAFGTKGYGDLFRVAGDHFLELVNELSPQTKAQLERLKGAEIDELVCHSNGARVAEVLISTGVITVHRLRILGGDNSLLDLDYLRRLGTEKRVNVSVYAMLGDVVPLAPTGWEIMKTVAGLGGPLEAFQHGQWSYDSTYQVLGLTDRPGYDPNATFSVHMFTSFEHPQAPWWHPLDWTKEWIVGNHTYSTYNRHLTALRAGGCFTPEGDMKPECLCR